MPKYNVKVKWSAKSEGTEYLEVEAGSKLQAREWAMDNIDPDLTRDIEIEIIDVTAEEIK